MSIFLQEISFNREVCLALYGDKHRDYSEAGTTSVRILKEAGSTMAQTSCGWKRACLHGRSLRGCRYRNRASYGEPWEFSKCKKALDRPPCGSLRRRH